MSKLGNAFVKLDKLLLVLFVVAVAGIGYFTLQGEGPKWAKKVRQAQAEAEKNGPLYPESNDPEGIVTVDCIQNGKVVRVKMTRRERDALIAHQSRR
jgi:hypothetical protein